MRYYYIRTFLEWLSVWKVVLCFAVWILIFAAVYSVGSQSPSEAFLVADKQRVADFPEALYFSIVTASTLGYGDITPTGWLRGAASVEVLGGLIFVGLAVSAIASIPMKLTRMAMKQCSGRWIERIEFRGNRNRVFYTDTRITTNGTSLDIFGENFDAGQANDKTVYKGTLIANQFPTLIFSYASDVPSEDYSSGISRVTMVQSASGHFNEYHGDCYDAKHGNRDQMRAYRVTDPETLRKLDDPKARREEMRRLVKELFQEEMP